MKQIIEIAVHLTLALFFLIGVAMLVQNSILLAQESPDVNIEDPMFAVGIIIASLCGVYHVRKRNKSSRFLLYGSVLSAFLLHSITYQIRTFSLAPVSFSEISITAITAIVTIFLFYLAYKSYGDTKNNT